MDALMMPGVIVTGMMVIPKLARRHLRIA